MALEKFHFTASTGEKFDVGFMNDLLSYRAAKKLRKQYKDDAEGLSEAFIEQALDADTLDKVENLSLRDFNDFMTGWTQTSDEEDAVGE